MRTIQVLLSMMIVVAAPGPVSASVCVADCDADGRVEVQELVSAVNVALGLSLVEGCRGADADGDGSVAVNEIIEAVGLSLTGCHRPLALAALDIVHAMVGALGSLEAIDYGVAIGIPRADEAFCVDRETPSERIPGPRDTPADLRDCVVDGSLRSQCHSIDISSFFQSRYELCRGLPDATGARIEWDGSVISTALDLGVCDPARSELTNFRSSLSKQFIDANGEVFEAVIHEDLVVASTPGPPVCGRWSDSARVMGRIKVFRPCLQQDHRYDFQGLLIENLGTGHTCLPATRWEGTVEILDHLHERLFTAVANDLTVTPMARESSDDATRVRIEGTLKSPCVGEFSVETRSTIIRKVGARCPSAGALRLELPTGSVAVLYSAEGDIVLDLEADGGPDLVLGRCNDAFSSCGRRTVESAL